MKKIAAVLCSFVFALVGCAADSSEPEPSTNTGEDLISLGGGTSGWSQACVDCENKCDSDYKTADTRAYCKKVFCASACGTKATSSGTFIY